MALTKDVTTSLAHHVIMGIHWESSDPSNCIVQIGSWRTAASFNAKQPPEKVRKLKIADVSPVSSALTALHSAITAELKANDGELSGATETTS